MKIRKWLALLLVGGILSTQMAFASEESDELAGIIMNVKTKVVIPEKLTEFEHESRGDDYFLCWRDEAGENAIYVVSETDGDIISYNQQKNHTDELENRLAKVSYDQAQQIAKSFLTKIVPEYSAMLKRENKYTPGQGEEYELVYKLYHKEIPVLDHEVRLTVNKFSGEVDHFSGFHFDEAAKYAVDQPKLSTGEAEKVFLSEIGMPLLYMTDYGKDESVKAFLAYQINNDQGKAVSALSGKIVTPYLEDRSVIAYDTMNTSGVMDSAATKIELSPAEQKRVEEVSGLLPADKLLSEAEKYFPVIKQIPISEVSVTSRRDDYYRQIYGEKKIDEIAEASFNLTSNARTGEIEDFSYWVDKEGEIKKRWSADDALAFLKKIQPKRSVEGNMKAEEFAQEDQWQNFSFERMYKGIPVQYQGFTITYDSALDQVIRYAKHWEDDIKFPSAQGVKSQEEVFKALGLNLSYLQVQKDQFELVYSLEEERMRLDAFTGKEIDASGEEIKTTHTSFYTDIAGHPYEKEITALYNSGIYLEGDKLYPDAQITQKEMLQLMLSAGYGDMEEERLYEIAASYKFLEAGEKNPTKKLTKEDGIKYMIDGSGYKTLATKTELFKYPYDESKVSEEMKGYITIAYGLGWLGESKDFMPKQPLTKAEVMMMIYRQLQPQK